VDHGLPDVFGTLARGPAARQGGACELRPTHPSPDRRDAVLRGARNHAAPERLPRSLSRVAGRGREQGDHLIFLWKRNSVGFAVGLHGWEPFSQAMATLKTMVESI
jgi:hypothetical protein